MASGWGINGNKGRCYDFWIDFSDCMSQCKQPKDCALLREDYLECLHHSKEFQRRNRVYKEEQRQIRAAARKAKEGEVDDMVSSKFLKGAKAKGASSSRTVSETAIPGDKTKEVIVLETSPEKTPEEKRTKRKHDSSSEQKEPKKKKKIAVKEKVVAEETVEAEETVVVEGQRIAVSPSEGHEIVDANTASTSAVPPSPSLIFVSGLPPPNVQLPRTFDQIDIQRTNAFMAHCPASADMRQLAIPSTSCVEEKKWLASLPADALYFETSKYFEMARLGYHATAAYCIALEKKCHNLEGTPLQQSQLAIAQTLAQKVQTERNQLLEEKEELLKTLKTKEDLILAQERDLEAKSKIIEEKSRIIVGKNNDLKTAENLLNDFKEKVLSLGADLSAKEQKWGEEKRALTQEVSEGRQKLRDIYKSDDFKIKVGESILPHWQQGIRIGVRQAVKAFEAPDAKIAYFEPDYEDDCGEPDIEDSDDEVESKKSEDPSMVGDEAKGSM